MAREKKSVTFEIQADAEEMLKYAASKYGLPDKDKALRCLLDYLFSGWGLGSNFHPGAMH
ncbi:MAG: hypothetical protein CMF69_10490 [Magnetovibrio sp.]|nr:hypothetical protein [Magnetovibrio sp.]|tara:strand:+ start:1173 stop:1352 length:180 start_codon:yes stop_codon:yes gene_type:complete